MPIPPWAVERAAAIGAEMVAGIRAGGVRIVGDLGTLADARLAQNVAAVPGRPDVPLDVAAGLLAGLVESLTRVPPGPPAGNRVVGPIEAEMRRRHEQAAGGTSRRPGVVSTLLRRVFRRR